MRKINIIIINNNKNAKDEGYRRQPETIIAIGKLGTVAIKGFITNWFIRNQGESEDCKF